MMSTFVNRNAFKYLENLNRKIFILVQNHSDFFENALKGSFFHKNELKFLNTDLLQNAAKFLIFS